MGRFSLLSIGLFILPIAITLAILIGVETWRVSTGKLPLSSQDNRITTEMYCQKEYGVQPNPGRYVCKSPCISSFGSPRSCPENSATGAIRKGLGPDSTFAIFHLDLP